MATATETQEIQSVEEATEQDILIQELRQKNLALQEEIVSIKNRSLSVYKENQQLQASPEINEQMARLEFDMKQAQYFVNSNALTVSNAAQAYIIMKLGEEIGLSPMVAIQALYIVNGQIGFHGKHLSGRLTGLGYKIDFTDESRNGVTVTISKGDFMESYVVTRDEQQLQRSKAMTFAAKNKMRFHGIRQIANFHLAHLFNGVPLWDADDMEAGEKRALTHSQELKVDQEQIELVIANLNKAETVSDLTEYYNLLDVGEKTKEVKNEFLNRKKALINGNASE